MLEGNLMQSSRIKRITDTKVEHVDDLLAVEAPLMIQLRYGPADVQTEKDISVTMRTPGNDAELALGFLFTEGIISDINQVEHVGIDPGENRVVVSLREGEMPSLPATDRNFYTTSSCGVCGKSSIDAIRTLPAARRAVTEVKLKAELFHRLEDSLRKEQAVFDSTGGLHASALFDFDGNLLILREDVGRHNALDKVIGVALKTGDLPLSNTLLLLSGRASFELIQKACMAGIAVVAAVGAPSSLAVELAEESNVTLIGFLRKNRLNIYSGAQRITA